MRTFLIFLFFFNFQLNYAQTKKDSIVHDLNQYLNFNQDLRNGTVVVTAKKENTKGSPYLFQNWAKGQVLLDNKELLQEPAYALNYDKMLHKLILKLPDNKIFFVNMEYVSGFTLSDSVSTYKLVKIPEISNNYLIELYEGSLYSLYKSIETDFYLADYENNGISEKGYKYDRYVDRVYYYLNDSSKRKYNIHSGNKSDLKKLGNDLPVVKSYAKEKSTIKDLDEYLINLVVFLNNK